MGLGFDDHLELLEWTGRCMVEGRVKGSAPRDRVEHGVLPESARPVLERMELDVENWVGTVEKYERSPECSYGAVSSILETLGVYYMVYPCDSS